MSMTDLSGLGDDEDVPTKRVVIGSVDGMPEGGHLQSAAVDAVQLGFEGRDPEWEEYQKWKAMKARQEGGAKSIAAIAQSNQPIGVRKTVKIICDETPEMPPTGYPLGLNGVAYIIRPGVEVDVPEGVLEVLKNAVTAVPIVDSLSQRVTGWRQRPRIPWRYVER